MSVFITLILHLAAAVAALVTPAPTTTVVTSAPFVQQHACEGDVVWTYATDDPGQTLLDCDLTPPQVLVVVFDEVSWGSHEGWGGDASLAWADRSCLDMGGDPVWIEGRYVECWNADY